MPTISLICDASPYEILSYAFFFSDPLSIERLPSPENNFKAVTYISRNQKICRKVRAVLMNINRYNMGSECAVPVRSNSSESIQK